MRVEAFGARRLRRITPMLCTKTARPEPAAPEATRPTMESVVGTEPMMRPSQPEAHAEDDERDDITDQVDNPACRGWV